MSAADNSPCCIQFLPSFNRSSGMSNLFSHNKKKHFKSSHKVFLGKIAKNYSTIRTKIDKSHVVTTLQRSLSFESLVIPKQPDSKVTFTFNANELNSKDQIGLIIKNNSWVNSDIEPNLHEVKLQTPNLFIDDSSVSYSFHMESKTVIQKSSSSDDISIRDGSEVKEPIAPPSFIGSRKILRATRTLKKKSVPNTTSEECAISKVEQVSEGDVCGYIKPTPQYQPVNFPVTDVCSGQYVSNPSEMRVPNVYGNDEQFPLFKNPECDSDYCDDDDDNASLDSLNLEIEQLALNPELRSFDEEIPEGRRAPIPDIFLPTGYKVRAGESTSAGRKEYKDIIEHTMYVPIIKPKLKSFSSAAPPVGGVVTVPSVNKSTVPIILPEFSSFTRVVPGMLRSGSSLMDSDFQAEASNMQVTSVECHRGTESHSSFTQVASSDAIMDEPSFDVCSGSLVVMTPMQDIKEQEPAADGT